mmetsp:Transcript_54591/g.65825  ORF Transcript_54591/g.65825 Transcript_54591/m.65825 type:complete len:96 (+) Transcript_54591:43-330(+)
MRFNAQQQCDRGGIVMKIQQQNIDLKEKTLLCHRRCHQATTTAKLAKNPRKIIEVKLVIKEAQMASSVTRNSTSCANDKRVGVHRVVVVDWRWRA